jgi:2-C-methyl-D-erythritol 4-phosphate cytidylyltransferase
MNATTARYWAVVPAAGSGSRMGADRPKQYLQLAGKPVLQHTLEVLLSCPALAGVVVAVAAGDPYWPALAAQFRDRPVHTVCGGEQRCHSVLRALEYLLTIAAPVDCVLVHDAARPCVRVVDIERLIATVGDDVNGGLLAAPVTDTLKRGDARQRVEATVDRSSLWRALTPQLFRIDRLQAALEHSLRDGVLVTDDAAAMEHAGYTPALVAGAPDNLKITVPEDLALAVFYLQTRQGR